MAVKACRHCGDVIGTRQPYGLAKTYWSCCDKYTCLAKEYPRPDLRIVKWRDGAWAVVTPRPASGSST